MKKYKYVVVSGCSFSACDAKNTPRAGQTYGDVVAKHFGAKCYNLAISGGSLPGMNRKTLKWCSKNKDKFNDTLIILGMTEVARFEFWNNKGAAYAWERDGFWDAHLPELVDLGVAEHLNAPKFSKEQVVNFYNNNALFILTTNIIIGLQSFLKLNNIDHIFFDALYPVDMFWENECDDKEDKFGHKLLFDNLVSQENWYKHPEYESMVDFTQTNPRMRIERNDNHPNRKAHKYWAECLIEFIDEKINT
jgi:hypothetical protein